MGLNESEFLLPTFICIRPIFKTGALNSHYYGISERSEEKEFYWTIPTSPNLTVPSPSYQISHLKQLIQNIF